MDIDIFTELEQVSNTFVNLDSIGISFNAPQGVFSSHDKDRIFRIISKCRLSKLQSLNLWLKCPAVQSEVISELLVLISKKWPHLR